MKQTVLSSILRTEILIVDYPGMIDFMGEGLRVHAIPKILDDNEIIGRDPWFNHSGPGKNLAGAE
jgi:hypothetical protein